MNNAAITSQNQQANQIAGNSSVSGNNNTSFQATNLHGGPSSGAAANESQSYECSGGCPVGGAGGAGGAGQDNAMQQIQQLLMAIIESLSSSTANNSASS